MSLESQRLIAYYKTCPWRRHLQYSRQRARRKGWTNTITDEQIHALWIRDNAHALKEPSIDRINPKLGYSMENCRFIEKRLNCRLGTLNRPTTEKQRITARKNILGWARGQRRKQALQAIH